MPLHTKSPSPFSEGLNFQPNHFYTAYWSAVNFQPNHFYPAYWSAVNFTYIEYQLLIKMSMTILPQPHSRLQPVKPIYEVLFGAGYIHPNKALTGFAIFPAICKIKPRSKPKLLGKALAFILESSYIQPE